MSRFYYIARDTKGEKITGIEEASVQEEVISRLQSRNLLVINVISAEKSETKPEIGPKTKLSSRHYRVTNEDVVLFCRQMATLLGAGVTILKSLDIISQQVSSRKLYKVIKDLQKGMEAGLSLHEAMAKHPKIFSELWVNLVESGEASGNLALVLNRLSGYLERMARFRGKVISALIYPVILLVGAIGALLFLTLKIIPTFAELFKGFNIQLPALTKMLIFASYFIRRYFVIIIACLVLFGYLLKRYIKTNAGRQQYERLLFNLPILGNFFRSLIVERFASEMSTLVESGVPILYSLEITEHSVDNLVVAGIIREIKENVRDGKPLSQPLEKSGFFEPMVVQMIAIGEEVGELSQMFKKIDVFYQEYVETFLTRITSMFEPFMLIFMAFIVGIMVMGMFLPIFQLTQISAR